MSMSANNAALFLLGILAMSVTSCMEDVDMDTGERILNVYCILNQEPEQSLELTYIAPTGGEIRPVEEDVTISLYENDVPVGEFTRTSETRWGLDFVPHGGRNYRLEVKVPGGNALTAETKYPAIASLRLAIMAFSDPDDYRTYYGNTGVELDSDEDQILWCYYENQENRSPVFSQYIVTDHPGVDARGETIYPFDPDSPIIKAEFKQGRKSAVYGEDWFYFTSSGIYSTLFYGEPAFLHDQVLRILHPAGFQRPIPSDQIHVSHLDGSDLHFEEGTTSSMFGIGGVNRTFTTDPFNLVICSVSDEYDQYLSDFYFSNERDDDFSALVYKRNHYSNIRNGTGVFGTSHEYRQTLSLRFGTENYE